VSTITVAIIIVASFAAWLVRWGCNRSAVPDEISYALGILIALLIFAAGPTVLGG
jgi:ABC-type nickel/cobalt efflux system permease component RcnA